MPLSNLTIPIARKNLLRRIVLVPLTACQGMRGVRVLRSAVTELQAEGTRSTDN